MGNKRTEGYGGEDGLDVLKLPEAERQAFETHMEDLHYQASMVESSYGVGMLKGREQGREEGIEHERITIARSLLDVLDDETIALKTGLTVDAVHQLR